MAVSFLNGRVKKVSALETIAVQFENISEIKSVDLCTGVICNALTYFTCPFRNKTAIVMLTYLIPK